MNHSTESRTEDRGIIASQAEAEFVKDTSEEDIAAASPFGSAAEVIEEEEVARELPPILDLPESEAPSVKAAPEYEAPPLESASVPAEEYELPRMGELTVEEPAPMQTSPAMSAEQSIYEDPMFGPIKRLLADFIGQG